MMNRESVLRYLRGMEFEEVPDPRSLAIIPMINAKNELVLVVTDAAIEDIWIFVSALTPSTPPSLIPLAIETVEDIEEALDPGDPCDSLEEEILPDLDDHKARVAGFLKEYEEVCNRYDLSLTSMNGKAVIREYDEAAINWMRRGKVDLPTTEFTKEPTQ